MTFRLKSIQRPTPSNRPTDPVSLFHQLRITDPSINDLWLTQGDALREWNEHRALHDVAVNMNTGSGKTLVGLLIAQSLVNEIRDSVIFACSSRQLVAQTMRKATGYGIAATTYLDQNFSDNGFAAGENCCITTYAALFTGRSRFVGSAPAAIVFDDAHTAANIIRDQFTLTIRRTQHHQLYLNLVGLFRPYFDETHQGAGYANSVNNLDGAEWHFLHPSALMNSYSELERILIEYNPEQHKNIMFPWGHLKNHLRSCFYLVSGQEIAITPPVVPIANFPYFDAEVRRIYLSATMTGPENYVRGFGRSIEHYVVPETTAGECERLILMPALVNGGTYRKGDVAIAKELLSERKTLVITPSGRRRESAWGDFCTNSDDHMDQQIEEFQETEEIQHLVLTARYDGIDLPGDRCRFLVVDDLPAGLNPLERYLRERLNLDRYLAATIASRVVQSFGRISRGMSDYGVVVVTGTSLIDWMLTPRNQGLLPEFLRKQLLLGKTISESTNSPADMKDVMEQCLSRSSEWLAIYDEFLKSALDEIPETADAEAFLRIAVAESHYGSALWNRDYEAAARSLEPELDGTFDISRSLGLWHNFLLGFCYQQMDNLDAAKVFYEAAHGGNSNIPSYGHFEADNELDTNSPQALQVAKIVGGKGTSGFRLPLKFDAELAALSEAATPRQVERALELLGVYLGLHSLRPDETFGTGPDVMWYEDGDAAVLEAKTDKQLTSSYGKDDLGQMRDHIQWTRNNYEFSTVIPVFVGPLLPASAASNPDDQMMVAILGKFAELRDRLRAALEDLCKSATRATIAAEATRILNERELLWPDLLKHLDLAILRKH